MLTTPGYQGRRLGRLHAQELVLEAKGGAGRNDAARSPLAVTQMGGDDELALSPHLHGAHPLVPSFDDPTPADGKGERLPAIHRAVELLAALEPSRIVHAHRVARLGRRPPALHQLHVAKTRGALDHLPVPVAFHL